MFKGDDRFKAGYEQARAEARLEAMEARLVSLEREVGLMKGMLDRLALAARLRLGGPDADA